MSDFNEFLKIRKEAHKYQEERMDQLRRQEATQKERERIQRGINQVGEEFTRWFKEEQKKASIKFYEPEPTSVHFAELRYKEFQKDYMASFTNATWVDSSSIAYAPPAPKVVPLKDAEITQNQKTAMSMLRKNKTSLRGVRVCYIRGTDGSEYVRKLSGWHVTDYLGKDGDFESFQLFSNGHGYTVAYLQQLEFNFPSEEKTKEKLKQLHERLTLVKNSLPAAEEKLELKKSSLHSATGNRRYVERDIEELKRALQKKEADIKLWADQEEKFTKEIEKLEKAYEKAKKEAKPVSLDEVMAEVKKIQRHILVDDAYISDQGNICVITKSLRAHKPDGEKLSAFKPMGKYFLKLCYLNSSQPYARVDNLDKYLDDHPHPHALSDGSLCWGDQRSVSNLRNDLLQEVRLYEYVDFLIDFLQTMYVEGAGPYTSYDGWLSGARARTYKSWMYERPMQ